MSVDETDPSVALATAFATDWGAVVATLIRVTGDWALAEDSAAEAFATVALTLGTLGGLEVAEVAAAFGVSEAAMAKRPVRARQKIAHARIPYRVPSAAELPERLEAVLGVLYLVFTEGYSPTSGAALRTDLSAEAIRLAGELATLLPGESEAHGLQAVMLMHDSRRTARVAPDGGLLPLEDQDRSLWDAQQIERGLAALEAGLQAATGRLAGPYLLQASIAACHATAPTPEATPWAGLVELYGALLAIAPSPHVHLARAVAVGMAYGPDAGLSALADLDEGEQRALRLAAEADLLRRARHVAEAAVAYRAAADLSDGAQRLFLQRRLAELEPSD